MIPIAEAPMLACAIRAENARPGFMAEARDCILMLLERGPQPGELLVDLCMMRGIVAPDARAFGVVFRVLSQRGQIKQVGYCERRKGHGCSGGRVWALA